MTQWNEYRIAAYRLIRCLELGNKTLRNIFSTVDQNLPAFIRHQQMWKDQGLTDHQRNALATSLQADIDRELQLLEREHINFILSHEDQFPSHLEHIPDAPIALFVRGSMIMDTICLAMVGTRKMTAYGKRCATHFSEACSESGLTIVSGLAFGIDAAAHRGALRINKPTVAILPCGIDDRSIMPQSHIQLAHEILENGGMLISEHAPGTPALPFLYLHRNRIISGLSDATLVIEADQSSGALTTAKLALEQGREVLAVPGPIWSDVSRGTNQLIKDGATPCTQFEDILNALGANQPNHISTITETRSAIPMTPAEEKILHALTEPTSADDLVRSLQLPASEINALLSILEMKGYVEQIERGVYERR